METQASQKTDLTAGEQDSGPNPVAKDQMPEIAEKSPVMDQPAAEEENTEAKEEGAQAHTKEAQVSPRTKASGRGLRNRWRPYWWRDLETKEGGVTVTRQRNCAKQRDKETIEDKAGRMNKEEQRNQAGKKSWKLNRRQPYSLEVKQIGDRYIR
ncbi:nuclear pore complex protein nup214 [Lasius niger]|uniref:Nuclear pore complex protein nup214 n=1 Tax=Lasius niger TaxID=67767 RepID=A0A0J7KLN6_LASNI|nr:nuclear pore complex protein nup214 [Lasius niger]